MASIPNQNLVGSISELLQYCFLISKTRPIDKGLWKGRVENDWWYRCWNCHSFSLHRCHIAWGLSIIDRNGHDEVLERTNVSEIQVNGLCPVFSDSCDWLTLWRRRQCEGNQSDSISTGSSFIGFARVAQFYIFIFLIFSIFCIFTRVAQFYIFILRAILLLVRFPNCNEKKVGWGTWLSWPNQKSPAEYGQGTTSSHYQ